MLLDGVYEQLINKMLSAKLEGLDKSDYYIKYAQVDKKEAASILARYLNETIQLALSYLTNEGSLEKQIQISNKVIQLLNEEIQNAELDGDLIQLDGKILHAVFKKLNASFSDFERYLREITPYTRFSQSELFTGSNAGISLESELKKEILSANRISFLVSFIKWTGIRIFEKELTEFTRRGGSLKVITTSYMGATDYKAIEFLSSLENTEVKISYNTENERLHAKAYLFQRNSGFHTGYIGSSNLSKSALTSGLEWNLKITTKEIAHVIDKFQKTFETYWLDKDFELFERTHSHKLKTALNRENDRSRETTLIYFDVTPHNYQAEILEKLQTERVLHSRTRNLLVAATGTGKTVISAFDFKRFKTGSSKARLLFVAHRKEILQQALLTFRGVLKDNNFGELWVDGIEPERYDCLFASVQTLNNRLGSLSLSKDYFDFIVIDEVHHISASSYRPIINYFTPQVLLGLTATPERMDGSDILDDFSNTIAAEIRLPEALNRKLLCPFQYFGITDSVDLRTVSWKNGRYLPNDLTQAYIANERRTGEIIAALDKYLNNIDDVRALCFCVTQKHAEFMSTKFNEANLRADYLTSSRDRDRSMIKEKFERKEINYLFVVDIFNEGVDVPSIDTILFLRPTESLTIFLQQLGRGLRLSDQKECLTVLDFVGNSHPEYDFEGKFRALVGKTNTSIQKELEDDFPHLPLGCTIVLEKKSKEIILENVRNATSPSVTKLISRVRNFKYQTTLPLTLSNFCEFCRIPLQLIYKRGGWKRLCALAGELDSFEVENERQVVRAIRNKWLTCTSYTYLSFILFLARNNFAIHLERLTEIEQSMCLMLHYDVWQAEGNFKSLQESIRAIGRNLILNEEIMEVLELLINRIDFLEGDVDLPYLQPLKVHARYTRDQIFAALGENTFERRSSNREGIVDLKNKSTELLLVTLEKTEEDYSPTTMYNDYAITDTLFHWQSQNSAHPESGKGLAYIEHVNEERIILLFVREKNQSEYGNTMGYVFLGRVNYQSHYGKKPMSINWELQEPIPPYLWKSVAKTATV